MTDNHWTPSPESHIITEIEDEYVSIMLKGKSVNLDADPKIWGYRGFSLRTKTTPDKWYIKIRSEETFGYPGRYKGFIWASSKRAMEEDNEECIKEWMLKRMIRALKQKIDYFWDHKDEVLTEYWKEEEEI